MTPGSPIAEDWVMAVIRARALPPVLHAANEALAFLLEAAMLAGLAWWGAAQHASVAVRIALAVAARDRDAGRNVAR